MKQYVHLICGRGMPQAIQVSLSKRQERQNVGDAYIIE